MTREQDIESQLASTLRIAEKNGQVLSGNGVHLKDRALGAISDQIARLMAYQELLHTGAMSLVDVIDLMEKDGVVIPGIPQKSLCLLEATSDQIYHNPKALTSSTRKPPSLIQLGYFAVTALSQERLRLRQLGDSTQKSSDILEQALVNYSYVMGLTKIESFDVLLHQIYYKVDLPTSWITKFSSRGLSFENSTVYGKSFSDQKYTDPHIMIWHNHFDICKGRTVDEEILSQFWLSGVDRIVIADLGRLNKDKFLKRCIKQIPKSIRKESVF